MSTKTKKFNTRLVAGCGMLTAVAVVLQYLEFPIPIMPAFIKMDFSDLPALIGAFAYGPIAGIVIELLKNVIHLLASQSLFIGELSNFLLGAIFVCTAGLIYKKKKTRAGAIIGGFGGALAMALFSVVSNYFVVYPIYYQAFAPEPVILQAYNDILSTVNFKLGSMLEALCVFNLPFTFVKGALCMVISGIIYKPLSPLLHGRKK